ncbi:NAD(+) diphosphatase [Aliidiomarina indica]|uniref:NAD(+) diphosphatase n=1 Tax=Aliidiomarina indica TaxID=2749147 RepID=UPI00188EE3D8|nr:NAD(+) diphosphatase [Aliidiomarina indica]
MIQPADTPQRDDAVNWFIVQGNQLLTDHDGKIPIADITRFPLAELEYTAKIGELEGMPAYVLVWPKDVTVPDGLQWTPLRQLLLVSDSETFALAGKACQVHHFLQTHQYCGRCGSETVQMETELAVLCPQCDFLCYPRISPCIIVAIYKGSDILLARGSRHPEGLFSILAGFVESGESLEQAVHREVLEEAGIQIKDVRYRFSQPWPFPHSLMAGFTAQWHSGTLVLDPSELIEGNWFALTDLPKTPPEGTIAARLIATVKAEVLDAS